MWNLIIGIIVIVCSSAFVADQQRKAQHEAQDKASKAAEAARLGYELQAGEYQDINRQQMAIQAMTSQTQQLDKVLAAQAQPSPNVLTLPSAENPGPLDRINRAIDDIVKGRW